MTFAAIELIASFKNFTCSEDLTIFIIVNSLENNKKLNLKELIHNQVKNHHNNPFEILLIEQENSGILNKVKLINIGSLFAGALMEEKCNKSQVHKHLKPIHIDILETSENGKSSYHFGKIKFFCQIYKIGMNLKTVIEYDDYIHLMVSDQM